MPIVIRDEAWAHVPTGTWNAMLARVAELEAAVLAEREACAKIAEPDRDPMTSEGWIQHKTRVKIAAAIRDRGTP